MKVKRLSNVLKMCSEVPHVKVPHSERHYSNQNEDIKHFSKDPSQEGGMKHLIA